MTELNLTPASDLPPDPEGARVAAAVRRAVLDVLPTDWQVLPDGRATHAVIARLAAYLLTEDTEPQA